MKISLLMGLIITTFMCVLFSECLAQNSPEDYLKIHNAARAEVGVKPLEWDSRLESYAYMHLSKHIGNCMPILSDGPYGESTLVGFGPGELLKGLTGAEAMSVWLEQKKNYDIKSNSCVGVICIGYIQIVWPGTTHVGCARVKCNNGFHMVSCNYNPPANYPYQRTY